jgi:Raf kinase inhibitor-like YbhB/YbcL family protein
MSGLRRRELLAGLAVAVAGCTGPSATTATGTPAPTDTDAPMENLTVTSPAFEDGAPIPDRYGKAYENVNPPLRFEGVPDDAASLAVIVDDPDAPGGTFDHWLVWNVPPDTTEIPEGWDPPAGVVQGTNDFGNVRYDGPKPPSEHTYQFEGYALDAELDLERGAKKDALESAMDGHVLASGTLTGTFAP